MKFSEKSVKFFIMTSSLKKLVVVLSFFIFFFAFSTPKTLAANAWNDCSAPNTLNCCIQDNRGQLAGCSAGDERYRWYSCERPTSVVKSCSDVCFVNNGVKGQCLTACPCGVGPGTSSNQTSCNAPGTAVFPPACIGGVGVGGIIPTGFTGGSGFLGLVINNLTNLKANFKAWLASVPLTITNVMPTPGPTLLTSLLLTKIVVTVFHPH